MWLAGCGSATVASQSNRPAASAGTAAVPAKASSTHLELPRQTLFAGPKPDFPASADGVVPAGYLKYPSQLAQSVQRAPGKGTNVTAMTFTINAPPPTVDHNPAWQAVNKALNANLQMPIISAADYNTKLSTVMASGDLPDIFTLSIFGSTIQNEPEFLSSKCVDLTPHLSGEAIKNYPNLANFPTVAWKNVIFGNKLYGIPRLGVGAVGPTMLVQQKQLDALGVKAIKSTSDFTHVLTELTRPGAQWGIGGNALQVMLQTYRAPNNWRESGGKFTKDWETPEYKEALAYVRGLWDAGVVHPDSASVAKVLTNFYNGRSIVFPGSFLSYDIAVDRILGINKNFGPLRAIPLFGYDGGQGVEFQDPGAQGFAVLKMASADRVTELLGILNHLAAPFGSEEYQTLSYGVRSVDFKPDANGNPRLTSQGLRDLHVPWLFLATGPGVMYDPAAPDYPTYAHPEAVAAHAFSIADPTVGLYSDTFAAKGAAMNRALTDGVNQIIFGQSPVSSFDQLLADWRSAGGVQVKREYEQSFAAAGT
ncbi:MAG: extracellular solute-binding protein [Chloroflexota bacterium]